MSEDSDLSRDDYHCSSLGMKTWHDCKETSNFCSQQEDSIGQSVSESHDAGVSLQYVDTSVFEHGTPRTAVDLLSVLEKDLDLESV